MADATEIDERFKSMPTHPTLRHFKKGISTISQWTGREHKHMERVFGTLIYGLVPHAVSAVARAIIDFIHYTSYHSHSTETLDRLQDALDTFHEHKSVFIKKGIQKHFRIPKIHAMEHYKALIRAHGTTDGFNTEISERLHIDFAKQGYRASNKKEYTRQMITYLDWREAMARWTSFLLWKESISEPTVTTTRGDPDDPNAHSEDAPSQVTAASLKSNWTVAKAAPFPSTDIPTLIDKHGAQDFLPCVQDFVEHELPNCLIKPNQYDCVDVYKRMSKDLPSPQRLSDDTTKDTVRAFPAYRPRGKRIDSPGPFDVVLIKLDPKGDNIRLESTFPSWLLVCYPVD